MGGGGEGAVASGAAVAKKIGAGFFSGMESVKVAPRPGTDWAERPALEATQGQNESLFSQLLYKCYFEEVASVGD